MADLTKKFWRGGALNHEDDASWDGSLGYPGGFLSPSSNWVLEDGSPAYAPIDGDTIIIGPWTAKVPAYDWESSNLEDIEDLQAEAYDYLSDLYHPYKWYKGHERGKCWGLFNFYVSNRVYPPGDEWFYGYWFLGQIKLKNMFIPPEFDGTIGTRKTQDELTYRWTGQIVNAMPVQFLSNGGIVYCGQKEAHIRCSGKVHNLVWESPDYHNHGGDPDVDSNIYFLDIRTSSGVVFLSSQLSDAVHRAKWHNIRIIDKRAAVVVQQIERWKWNDEDSYIGYNSFFESAEGTVVGEIVLVPNADILVERGCVDHSLGDLPLDYIAKSGNAAVISPLGLLTNCGGNVTLSALEKEPKIVSANINDVLSLDGEFDWRTAGILKELNLLGGRVKAANGLTKIIGSDENTIAMAGGTLDLAEQKGKISTPEGFDLRTDCIGYWPLDDNDTENQIDDFSTYNAPLFLYATIARATNLDSIIGKVDRALNYPTSPNTYAKSSTVFPQFSVKGAFSICFWFKTAITLQNLQPIIYITEALPVTFAFIDFIMNSSTGRVTCHFCKGHIPASDYCTLQTSAISEQFADDIWRWICVTFDRTLPSNRGNLYLNEPVIPVDTDAAWDADIHSGTASYMVLAGTWDIYPGYSGDLDDLRFYNRALTEAERIAIYNGGLGQGGLYKNCGIIKRGGVLTLPDNARIGFSHIIK